MSWAVNWNVNDGKLNVNANPASNPNDWNDGYRVFGGYLLLSSALDAEVFVISPFRHPPIMRPISSMVFANDAY